MANIPADMRTDDYVLNCTGPDLDEAVEATKALSQYLPVLENLDTALSGKVDKVEGKDLSTNDYTTAEKNKLAGIAAGANNYVHPATHPVGMITGLGTAATKDAGTAAGNVPIIGSNGKLPGTIVPADNNKVDKVEGKDLSTNDYTTAEKAKLAGIATGANNYVHPSTHPSTMITGLGTAATKNTGTVSGSIPLIGSDGLLPTSVLPPPLTVENVLTSTSTVNALSAAQGKILADQIDGLTASDITYEGTDLNSALLTLDSRVLAAQTDAQGALAGITSLQTTIGDIGTILDDINGEVV